MRCGVAQTQFAAKNQPENFRAEFVGGFLVSGVHLGMMIYRTMNSKANI